MHNLYHNQKICFILLPGFSPDNVSVLPLKNAFEQRGYIAIASTFFGDRSFKYFSQLTMEQCQHHVSQLIQEAKQQYDRVIGIGVSLGGALFLEYAKTSNDLDGIVSIGIPFRLKYRPLMSLGKMFLSLIYPLWKIFEKRKQWRLLPIGAAPQIIDYLETDFLKNLEQITVPTLFIHSKQDSVTDYRVLPEYFEKIGSVAKHSIITENGNHVIDHDPDALVNHTLSFYKL